jgi:DNA-binding transcriptional ArsR family regulator
MTRQAISKHLAILEDARLVTTEWSGRQKLHSLNREPIEKMSGGWLQTLLARGQHQK